jgi:hypothetical protein
LFIFSIYIKISHELPINHMKQSIAEPLADNTALWNQNIRLHLDQARC